MNLRIVKKLQEWTLVKRKEEEHLISENHHPLKRHVEEKGALIIKTMRWTKMDYH
jgi:hypothetical protein